jgi:hypothetical protein
MRRLTDTTPVVVFVLLVLMSAAPVAAQDAQARIKAASAVLLGPPDPAVTQADVVKALVELMDVAVFISGESPYTQDIHERINVARDLMMKTSIFNDKARQYVSFAHRMLSGGKKYEKPKELEEFVTPQELQEKSRKYGASLADGALAELGRGRKLEAARLLLELVLAVVTPVSGAPVP